MLEGAEDSKWTRWNHFLQLSAREAAATGAKDDQCLCFWPYLRHQSSLIVCRQGGVLSTTPDTKSVHNENSTEASLGRSFPLSNNNLVTDKYQESQRNFVSEGCIISLTVPNLSNFSLQIYCSISILEIFQIDVLIQDALHDVCAAARVGVGDLAVQLSQHLLQANTKKDKLKKKNN